MMPEGPEVRNVVDQLQGGVGKRLVDIKFVSGRYTKHGRPGGFQDFATTMTPSSSELIDTVEEWNCKGKFIYLVLDEGGKHTDKNNTDFCRSIWVTLGMTGQFVNEQIHEQDPRFCRWYFELMDVESGLSRKVYYHDQRNFGTLKFCLSKLELEKKILSLGPDVLSE
jgi:formamidopyrimidine-DNA glycosylase